MADLNVSTSDSISITESVDERVYRFEYGLKVSRPGFDVSTKDNRSLSLNSGITLMKVRISGSATVARNTEGSADHNLGYVPQFLIYGEDPNNASNMNVGNASWSYSGLKTWADSTKVYWYIQSGSGGPYDIYYYVFYDAI